MQEFHIKILLIVKLFLDIPSVNLGQSNLFCSWTEFQAIIDRDRGMKF